MQGSPSPAAKTEYSCSPIRTVICSGPPTASGSLAQGVSLPSREGVVEELRLQRRESAGLEETFFEQNRLLTERLGAESESGLGRRGWHFPWGSVTSLLDGKTGECVIWAEYLREQL